MLVVRWAVLFLLIAAAVCFGAYAITSDPKFRRYGLVILKWTLAAGFVFFAVLIAERI